MESQKIVEEQKKKQAAIMEQIEARSQRTMEIRKKWHFAAKNNDKFANEQANVLPQVLIDERRERIDMFMR